MLKTIIKWSHSVLFMFSVQTFGCIIIICFSTGRAVCHNCKKKQNTNVSNSGNIRGTFDTHKKVFLLAINIGCAYSIVGFVFLLYHFLVLWRKRKHHVKADHDTKLTVSHTGKTLCQFILIQSHICKTEISDLEYFSWIYVTVCTIMFVFWTKYVLNCFITSVYFYLPWG